MAPELSIREEKGRASIVCLTEPLINLPEGGSRLIKTSAWWCVSFCSLTDDCGNTHECPLLHTLIPEIYS
jgi:hypothetical protein